jgi:tyrosyl-tRNA synthetase
MNFEKVIGLTSHVTIQQILHRDDFKKRMHDNRPIRTHEILYPIMQGWDSVMIGADVELGGTDQLFNILMGRELQRVEGKPEQVVFLMPLLEGLDGSEKMSKSLNNYVGINEVPSEIFGKLMSISDELMARYYELLLRRAAPTAMHPLDAKKELAFKIVQTYHSADAARKALEDWNTRFSKRDLDRVDLPAYSPPAAAEITAVALVLDIYRKAFRVDKSRSEISRLIKQGSVEINATKVTDPMTKVALHPGQIVRLDRKHAVRIH